jgi:drug/metabolite transporter (DMT)-like permease
MASQEHTTLPQGRDIPLLLLGILGIGSSGPFIAKSSMPIPSLIFWRNFMGALSMAPFAIRKAEWRTPAGKRAVIRSILAGVILAGHFLAFFAAMRFTSVATGTALTSLQPIFAALYMKYRGAHISRQSLAGIFLAFISLLAITGIDLHLSTRAFEGDLYAIIGGALAAGYVIVGSGVQKEVATSTYLTFCFGTCSIVAFIVALVGGFDLFHFAHQQWFLAVGLFIGAQFLGHTLFNMTLKRVSPVMVSLIVFFEVPVAALIAWFWNGQHPARGTIPGIIGLLIGCAIFVLRNNSNSVSQATNLIVEG